jgi:biopolymer transport protein ExbD
MQVALRSESIQPMGEMNTTPLIDVMLVLLIMFIVTIPTQTHGVKMDLPTAAPFKPDAVKNKIVITEGGQLLWNSNSVDIPTLRAELAATASMQPQPELQIQPEATARYEIVDEVLAETKRAHLTRLGFVGNERYAGF